LLLIHIHYLPVLHTFDIQTNV